MFRKYISIIIITLSIIILPTIGFTEENPIKVIFEGEQLKFEEQPFIENDVTLVQFRPIFEKIGLKIEWDQKTQTITGRSDDLVIKLKINSNKAVINDEIRELVLAPRIVNGNTMVPLRFVGEASKNVVKWNENTRVITIGSNNESNKPMDIPAPTPTKIPEKIGSNYIFVANGKKVDLDTPIIKDGDTFLIPLRNLAESLELKTVIYYKNPQNTNDHDVQSIYSSLHELRYSINSKIADFDGDPIELESNVQLINNITMLPMRVVIESFGGSVIVDEVNRMININAMKKTITPTPSTIIKNINIPSTLPNLEPLPFEGYGYQEVHLDMDSTSMNGYEQYRWVNYRGREFHFYNSTYDSFHLRDNARRKDGKQAVYYKLKDKAEDPTREISDMEYYRALSETEKTMLTSFLFQN